MKDNLETPKNVNRSINMALLLILGGISLTIFLFLWWTYTGDCAWIDNYLSMPSHAALRLNGWSEWDIFKFESRVGAMMNLGVCW